MKPIIFLRRLLLFSLCTLSAAALTSCGITEPKESATNANTPPETRITSGPKQGSAFSYSTRITWIGEDNDGVVRGYNLVVDGQSRFVTTTDSTFTFTAANQDEQHSISVAAVDNKDAVDATPATLTFTATNAVPNTALMIEGNPAPGATFGRGGVFTIVPQDVDNGPEYSYRFNLDNGAWSAWLTNNVIEFSTTSPFGLLPEGSHTFNAQVRDAAMAVDETPAQFPIVVSASVKPGVSLTAQYNAAPFYDDNSAFVFPATDSVEFAWSPIFNYAGARSTGSRYRIDGGAWTEYSTAVSSLKLFELPPGPHTMEVQYRDLGGVESDVALFAYNLVAPSRNSGVLIVDDGDGRFVDPRNPTAGDATTDAFYREVFTATGARFALWDLTTQGNITPGRGLGNYSTVVWQSDEAFYLALPQQTKVMTEYLSLGGNLWIVGWKPINQLAGSTPVTNFVPSATTPASYDFIYNYLKIASSKQSPASPADFIGARGEPGHPDLNVEATKNFNPAAQNRLSQIDVFTLRPEAQPIYTFVSNSGNPDFQGTIAGSKYLGQDFKTVVFGYPFYHMKTAEAIEAARKILTDLGEL